MAVPLRVLAPAPRGSAPTFPRTTTVGRSSLPVRSAVVPLDDAPRLLLGVVADRDEGFPRTGMDHSGRRLALGCQRPHLLVRQLDPAWLLFHASYPRLGRTTSRTP